MKGAISKSADRLENLFIASNFRLESLTIRYRMCLKNNFLELKFAFLVIAFIINCSFLYYIVISTRVRIRTDILMKSVVVITYT